MKKAKKIVSVILALMLVLGMTSTVFAAGNDGKITIDNAVDGQKYSVYQILDLESLNADAGAYAYKANSKWESWLEEQTAYVAFDDQGYVTWIAADDDATVAAFAKAAKAYANGKIDPAQTKEAEGSTVEFTGLDLGWYLVDTTLGTICSLDTTNKNVTMKEKNAEPSITKEVQEDSTNTWGKVNDADINQVVNFKATITVQKGAENYVMHDTMSEGLTYIGVTSVKVGDTAVAADNYTVKTDMTDGCTFEVAFTDAYVGSLTAETQIVVEYSARLNENAVIAGVGNPNTVQLEYGDANDSTFTTEQTTVTYTWDAKVVKYTVKDGEDVVLSGATFKISSDEDGNNIYKFHALENEVYQVCAHEGTCTAEHVTTITTTATGEFKVEGLDAGTYWLTETVAPAGYNQLPGPVSFEIKSEANEDGTELSYTQPETRVLNNTGAEMPMTGGMGTTILYIIGAILVIGAGVTLVARRRVNG